MWIKIIGWLWKMVPTISTRNRLFAKDVNDSMQTTLTSIRLQENSDLNVEDSTLNFSCVKINWKRQTRYVLSIVSQLVRSLCMDNFNMHEMRNIQEVYHLFNPFSSDESFFQRWIPIHTSGSYPNKLAITQTWTQANGSCLSFSLSNSARILTENYRNTQLDSRYARECVPRWRRTTFASIVK